MVVAADTVAVVQVSTAAVVAVVVASAVVGEGRWWYGLPRRWWRRRYGFPWRWRRHGFPWWRWWFSWPGVAPAFRGGSVAQFRGGGAAFRGGSVAQFRGGQFRGGTRFVGRNFYGGRRFARGFGPGFGLAFAAAPFYDYGYYGYSGYDNGCYETRLVRGRYGWRYVQVDVCDYGYSYY